jgi:peptidoglycan/LPS O-acetylase OafA/YrhL/lysophospholipase L1-like esterase
MLRRMRRTPALDGLRAVAVLAVFARHLQLPLASGGWLGVDVFFVLSGYLITTLLLREHDRDGRIALGRFYLRRARRLYPALIVVLAAGLTFAATLSGDGTLGGYLTAAALAGTYTTDLAVLVTGNGDYGALTHMWSLAVEEQFYLLWPVALVFALRRGVNVVAWSLAGAGASLAVLASSLNPADQPTPLGYFYPHTRAYELLLGCTLAAWLTRQPLRKPTFAATVGAVGLAGLILAVGVAGTDRFTVPAIAAAGALSCLLVAGLATGGGGPAGRLLGVRPLVYLGRISYGIYLWHLPVLTVLGHFVHASLSVSAVLAVAVTTGIAAASHRWVESPFLRPREAPNWARLAAPVSALTVVLAAGVGVQAHQQSKPLMVVVGDSYSAGSVGVKPYQAFPPLVADRLGTRLALDAEPATGYVADGHSNRPSNAPYADRLPTTPRNADIIVVTGGRNDTLTPGDASQAPTAVRAYLTALRVKYPTAPLVVLSPFWPAGAAPTAVTRERAATRAAATDVGAHWVDTSRWLPPSMIGPDGIHPTPAGQREIARRLAGELAPVIARI